MSNSGHTVISWLRNKPRQSQNRRYPKRFSPIKVLAMKALRAVEVMSPVFPQLSIRESIKLHGPFLHLQTVEWRREYLIWSAVRARLWPPLRSLPL